MKFIMLLLFLLPFQETPDEAQYWKAVDYIDMQDFESGYALVRDFETNFPNSEWKGHAYFMKGACEVAMMDNKTAIKTFTAFLEKYPEAPERMQTGAWRQIQLIARIDKRELSGIAQKMEYTQRMLELGKTKGSVVIEQKKIVELLTKMIGESEEQEKKSRAEEKGKPEPSNPEESGDSTTPNSKSKEQGESRNPDGFAKRSYSKKGNNEWSKLRDRERDPAFNVIKEKFPARYKELIDKYYRSFQK